MIINPSYIRAVLGGGLPALLLLFAACSQTQKSGTSSGATRAQAVESTFIGNDACQPCHAAEFKSHRHSRHMQTLHDATRSDLKTLAPPAGVLPGGGKLAWEGDQLVFVAPDKDSGTEISAPLDLVLGSGKTGMTLVALDSQECLELRHSYFPHEKSTKWIITPGQEALEGNVVGQIHPAQESRMCIGCHAVVLPEGSLRPEKKFYGVGCESCHGPGSAHVDAAKRGVKPSTVGLFTFSGEGGARINLACGRCHRTSEAVEQMDSLAKQATNRFQPYGLAKSRCFTQSNDTLSCVTCHNPHEDSSTDHRTYEKTCLSCHSAPKKTCPINPKEKCVSCHMPNKPVFPGTTFPIKMADHFIRVYKDGKPTR